MWEMTRYVEIGLSKWGMAEIYGKRLKFLRKDLNIWEMAYI